MDAVDAPANRPRMSAGPPMRKADGRQGEHDEPIRPHDATKTTVGMSMTVDGPTKTPKKCDDGQKKADHGPKKTPDGGSNKKTIVAVA